nr:hypothetical protein CFP56_49070 [Quercus suber]
MGILPRPRQPSWVRSQGQGTLQRLRQTFMGKRHAAKAKATPHGHPAKAKACSQGQGKADPHGHAAKAKAKLAPHGHVAKAKATFMGMLPRLKQLL